MDRKIAVEKIEQKERKEIVDIRHYLKGVIWDILIDVYMQDANLNEKETDARLEEIQSLMSKIEQNDILKFGKNLLQELENLTDQEDIDIQKTFEEVFLNS
jgi:hypothetical protein